MREMEVEEGIKGVVVALRIKLPHMEGSEG